MFLDLQWHKPQKKIHLEPIATKTFVFGKTMHYEMML